LAPQAAQNFSPGFIGFPQLEQNSPPAGGVLGGGAAGGGTAVFWRFTNQ